MRIIGLSVLTFAICLFSVSPTAAAPVFNAPAGYKSTAYYTHTGSIQGFDFDSGGNLYLYKDNRYINRYSGGSETTLFDYGDSSKYGSFLTVNGGTVYFGESSSGKIRTVSTGGGSATELFTLDYNYDMAFNSSGQGFLSANPSFGGTKIYFWNGTQTDLIGDMGGASGPLAFDAGNKLFYGFGTMSNGEIVYFTSAQVAGAVAANNLGAAELDSDDWVSYITGLDACSGFAFDDDAGTQDLFSSSFQNTVTRVDGLNSSDAFGTGGANNSQSFMRFIPGPGEFEAYAGADGGSLYVLTTDWSDWMNPVSAIYEVSPIPEPATCLLFTSGLMGMFALSKRRKR